MLYTLMSSLYSAAGGLVINNEYFLKVNILDKFWESSLCSDFQVLGQFSCGIDGYC